MSPYAVLPARPISFGQDQGASAGAGTAAPPAGGAPMENGELATTMVMRGAFGVLLGAAVAPRGREGIWAAGGFVVGTMLGQPGLLAMALAALWQKANK